MGKASNRRRVRRQRFLSRLAEENPERFEREWGKRVDSWAREIWSAGKDGEVSAEPVFNIADHALNTLAICGEKAVEQQFSATKSLLENECCQTVALNVGRAIYDVTQRWDRDIRKEAVKRKPVIEKSALSRHLETS